MTTLARFRGGQLPVRTDARPGYYDCNFCPPGDLRLLTTVRDGPCDVCRLMLGWSHHLNRGDDADMPAHVAARVEVYTLRAAAGLPLFERGSQCRPT